MRVIVDGDACPQRVKEICEKICTDYNIDLIIVVDMAHFITSDFTVITVEQGSDAVDYRIVEIFRNEDILVTQDYGLASLVIKKASAIIHTAGYFINNKNIDTLLESRYLGQKIRKAGGKTKGPAKRTKEQDDNFEKCLIKAVRRVLGIKER